MQNKILKNDLKDLIYIYKKFYFGKYLVLNMYYIKDYISDNFLTVKHDAIRPTWLSAISNPSCTQKIFLKYLKITFFIYIILTLFLPRNVRNFKFLCKNISRITSYFTLIFYNLFFNIIYQ